MKYSIVVGLMCMLDGCSGAAKEGAASVKYTKMAELGSLMKNDINPAFSKLSFLLFHGDEMQEDPATIKGELQRSATSLRSGIRRLRDWAHPPTTTSQGREVFYTYAVSVDTTTEKLLQAIDRNDRVTAGTQLDRIADTCNNCHHFFRLELEDTVARPAKMSRLDGTTPLTPLNGR